MRTAFFCLLTALLGLSIGLAVNYEILGEFILDQQSIVTGTVNPPTPTEGTTGTNAVKPNVNTTIVPETEEPTQPFIQGNEALLTISYDVLEALKEDDFTALSKFIHPEYGLRFTPYSTVSVESDIVLMPIELSQAENNSTLYIWGMQDGSGLPLQMTITEYFADYVYNQDFITAPYLSINKVLSSGNSLENVITAYPDGDFVEFYLPQVSPTSQGFDWCAIKLVFESYNESYKLVGLIHSQWTI